MFAGACSQVFTASSDVREALQRMDAGLEAKFVSIEKSEFLLGQDHAGVLALWGGLPAALWGSTAFVVLTWLLTKRLPPVPEGVSVTLASVDAGD